MKQKHELRALYMQMRMDAPTQEQEYNSFSKKSGLERGQIRVWNVFEEPHFPMDELEQYDLLFAGGSSDDPKDTPVLDPEKLPWAEDAMAVCRYFFEAKKPAFLSCMGFLVATQALGGSIIIDKANNEEGFTDIHLTEDGKKDPLLSTAQAPFPATSFHIKRVSEIPVNTTLLAYSDKCPVHAYRGSDRPFYAFQFHPEINREDLISILHRYADRYMDDEGTAALTKRLVETTPEMSESEKLVATFVDQIVLGNPTYGA